MAPPRHRRKRRPSRTVSTTTPVVEPEPEPLPPPRRGMMAALFAPPPAGSSRAPRPMMSAAPSLPGIPWTRRDFLVLSGIAGVVVVVVGLLIGLTDTTSSTEQKSPAPTASSFSVASGAGKTFLCGPTINLTVGSTVTHIAAVDGDRITLADPLEAPPSSGTTVSQSMVGPGNVAVCASVASSPAPTTTQFTLAGGAGVDFVAAGLSLGGQQVTVKNVDSSNYRLTLSSALPTPPEAGTAVVQDLYTTGSLIGGIVGLAISEISIIILAVAAWVSRPFAVRIVKKARPGILETFVFGALIAVVDTLVYFLEVSTLGSTTGAGVAIAEIVAVISGFILVPLAYPAITRMFFRRRQRQGMAGPSGR